jgi:putative ABC transport system substrate-binding protein
MCWTFSGVVYQLVGLVPEATSYRVCCHVASQLGDFGLSAFGSCRIICAIVSDVACDLSHRPSDFARFSKSRKHADELVALVPDVIIPIVFNNVADPVGGGFVKSMARPGGNTTGFIQFESSLSGKWLELLKEIAPSVTRVAVLRDAAITSGIGQFAVIQSVTPSIGVDVSVINGRETGEIESDIADFARTPNGGLILTAGANTTVHGELIVALAARNKLPAVYFRRAFVASGGLVSYGYDVVDQYRRAAGYVDRILKGERPADLPVQAPSKYELVINLKTAKALGLPVPHSLLARADEVIE